MTNLSRALFAGLALLAFCTALAGLEAKADARPALQSRDIVAFCRIHRDLDYPGKTFFGAQYEPDMLPRQVEDVEASNWRCMDGKVFMCSNSADGDSCSKKDPSRQPSQTIKETCADDPGSDPDRAATAYSSFMWHCNGRKPVIVQSYPLDKRGFMKAMWVRYIVRNGVVIEPHNSDFPDPR